MTGLSRAGILRKNWNGEEKKLDWKGCFEKTSWRTEHCECLFFNHIKWEIMSEYPS